MTIKLSNDKCVWNGVTNCDYEGVITSHICIECLANRLCKLEKEGD